MAVIWLNLFKIIKMLWHRIYEAFLTFKLGLFREFGTIDLNYCFFHSQEWEKSKSD